MATSTPLPPHTGPKVAAMLLAAGRGERMRPLTDTCPKPLLSVRGQPLMQWHLQALAQGAASRVVINTAWLGDMIAQRYKGVFAWQPASVWDAPPPNPAPLPLLYSHEGRDFGGALETAGGICRALPQLCTGFGGVEDVFWVLAGDVFTPGFEFTSEAVQRFVQGGKLAHLWLVPNPAHNPRGDFGLDETGAVLNLRADDPRPRFTYSTIGLYHRALFSPPWCDIPPGNPQGAKAALAPLLRAAMDQGQVTGELYTGAWTDVGTPQRLAELNAN